MKNETVKRYNIVSQYMNNQTPEEWEKLKKHIVLDDSRGVRFQALIEEEQGEAKEEGGVRISKGFAMGRLMASVSDSVVDFLDAAAEASEFWNYHGTAALLRTKLHDSVDVIIDGESVSINIDRKNVLHWYADEWIEDHNVVFSILNAVMLAKENPDALMQKINKLNS